MPDAATEIRELALKYGAVEPCPRHPDLLLLGHVEGLALAAFRIGTNLQKQAALRDLLEAALPMCPHCERTS